MQEKSFCYNAQPNMFFLETFELEVNTTGGTDILDLTPGVADKVQASGMAAGLLNLFIAGSTAALTTIEYESGVVNDLRDAIERLFPKDLTYLYTQPFHQ